MPVDAAADEPPRSGDDPPAADDGEAAEPDPPIEPGSPAIENVVFVLLGVAMALAIVLRLVQLFG